MGQQEKSLPIVSMDKDVNNLLRTVIHNSNRKPSGCMGQSGKREELGVPR